MLMPSIYGENLFDDFFDDFPFFDNRELRKAEKKLYEVTQEEIRAEFKHRILKLTIPEKERKPAVEQIYCD